MDSVLAYVDGRESLDTPFWPVKPSWFHKQVECHFTFWNDKPPTCSPFLVPTVIILGLFNCLNIVSKKDWCKAMGTATALSFMAPLLPVCMAISDDNCFTAYNSPPGEEI